MKYLRILALLLLVALIGLGANGGCGCPGPAVGMGRITGYVASSVLVTTRIPGATVTAVGGGKTYTTVTDEQGNYTLIVPAGTYDVSASKETFNTKTENGVSVTADATKTVNFSLTTGAGGTTEISIRNMEIITITHPSQFDIRSIKLDRNLRPDIESILKSYPSNIRSDEFDYRSAFIILAEFNPSPPSGAQGSRIYVGTSPNGPFILKSSLDSYYEGVFSIFNMVCELEPNTTYYIYPSLYGTWGENIAEEYMEVSTPDELVLIAPDNNYVASPGENVTFEWTGLGEGWTYFGDIKKETTGETVGNFSTTDASYSVSIPLEAEPGNYLWRVMGIKSSGGPTGLSRPNGFYYSQYSISYPRRLTIEQGPVD